MRKYDYNNMERALVSTEDSEARQSLRLLELNWEPKQILQFFRERDRWREVRVLQVQPVIKTTKADEREVHVVHQTTEETVTDQSTVTPAPETKSVSPNKKK